MGIVEELRIENGLSMSYMAQNLNFCEKTFFKKHDKVTDLYDRKMFKAPQRATVEKFFTDSKSAVARRIPAFFWSLMIPILALCSVKYSLVFGGIEVFDILPPHNGRTVAPEAILFESPCRAHPET